MSAPTITTQPVSQLANVNTQVTFTVQATSTTTLSYQWYYNCVGISGATNSSYTINSVSNSNIGLYYVIVSNSSGSTQSSNAILTIINIPQIISQPLSQTVEAYNSVAFSVVAINSYPLSPLTYQWYFNGAVIPCATSPIYEICSAQTSNNGIYYVVVSNSAGSVQSSNATLIVTVVDLSPRICKQPKSKKVYLGESVKICVSVESDSSYYGKIKYQWYFDKKKIKCANSCVYEIEHFSKHDIGKYYVEVSNDYCSVQSSNAELTLCCKK
jgi:hypothetical protein